MDVQQADDNRLRDLIRRGSEQAAKRENSRVNSWLNDVVRRATGIDHGETYYSHFLHGRKRCASNALAAICDALGIDKRWAFETHGYPQVGPEDEDPIIPSIRAIFARLDRERQEQIAVLLPDMLQFLDKTFALAGAPQTAGAYPSPDGYSYTVNQPREELVTQDLDTPAGQPLQNGDRALQGHNSQGVAAGDTDQTKAGRSILPRVNKRGPRIPLPERRAAADVEGGQGPDRMGR